MLENEKVFPTYLTKGSKGPGVRILQLLLLAMKLNPKIVADGDYRKETAAAVEAFQIQHKIKDEAGDFGPKTQEVFLEETGVDVRLLLKGDFMGFTTTPQEFHEVAHKAAHLKPVESRFDG